MSCGGAAVPAAIFRPGPVYTGFGERAGFSKEDAEAAIQVDGVIAEEAARSAVEGMAKGRLVVIPGKVNRLAAAVSEVTPRTLLLPGADQA